MKSFRDVGGPTSVLFQRGWNVCNFALKILQSYLETKIVLCGIAFGCGYRKHL